MIGDRGMTLSGGQKARISLARAVYQDFDIYLIDDPFASVDIHVGQHIYEKCILGLLKNKTKIVSTHHQKYLFESDMVLKLDSGQVMASGSAKTILKIKDTLKEKETKSDNQTEKIESNRRIGSKDQRRRRARRRGRKTWGLYNLFEIRWNKTFSPYININFIDANVKECVRLLARVLDFKQSDRPLITSLQLII